MPQKEIAVFNLPDDTRERDIDDLFGKFGRINRVALREGRTAKMCFIEYDDGRDAEEAVDRRHEYDFGGNTIRVEFSRGGGPRGGGGGRRGRSNSRRGGRRGGRDSRRRGGRDSRRRAPPKKDFGLNPMWHKVTISGMPPSASWQDMKDFFRAEAQAKYTDVLSGGEGVAGFASREEAERVVDRLDGIDFKDRDGRSTRVKLVYEPKEGSRGRSRSRSGKKNSRSRSRSGSRSRSR